MVEWHVGYFDIHRYYFILPINNIRLLLLLGWPVYMYQWSCFFFILEYSFAQSKFNKNPFLWWLWLAIFFYLIRYLFVFQIGDLLMCYLLRCTSIFLPVKKNDYFQVSGVPLNVVLRNPIFASTVARKHQPQTTKAKCHTVSIYFQIL